MSSQPLKSLSVSDYTYYVFLIDPDKQGDYQYYEFEVLDVDADGNTTFQMSELVLYTD